MRQLLARVDWGEVGLNRAYELQTGENMHRNKIMSYNRSPVEGPMCKNQVVNVPTSGL